MTTYNTGNPVPSADARDRYDNSQTLDEVVNGDSESYSSRTGKQVISLGGMNSRFNNAQDSRESAFNLSQEENKEEFQSFLDGTGWSSLGAYGAGVTITSHTQTVDYQGQPYQLKPSIPASLDAPYITAGAWATEGVNFKLVGDNSLRQDLATLSEVDKAAAIVGRSTVTVESLAELASLPRTRKLTAMLQLKNKSGSFFYDQSDLSSFVSKDALKGIYVPPSSDPSGVSGAWVRQYGQAVLFDGIKIDWFGAGADDPAVDSAPACVAATILARAFAGTFTYSGSDMRARVMVSPTPGKNYYIYSTAAVDLEGARVDFGCISGKANFIGANPATPTVKNPLGFSFNLLYDTTFKNISFASFGKIHEWDTNNLDSALVIYDHCEFHNSGVPGIPVIDTRSFAESRSTDLSFVNCRSSLCPRLLNSYCDTLRFIGGVYRNADPNGALVLADSGVTVEGGMWVPYFHGDLARWFDLYDNLRAGSRGLTTDGVRFSPESGGIPIVYNFMDGSDASTNRFTNSIVIKGGSAAAAPGTAAHTGLIVLADNGDAENPRSIAPSFISIDGSVRSRTGLVRTQSGAPIDKLRGRFAIQISEAAQSHLSTHEVSPVAPLVEAQLYKYLVGRVLFQAPLILTGSAAMTIAIGAAGPDGTYNIQGSGAVVNALTEAFDGEVVTLVFQNAGGVVKDASVSGDMYLAGGANFTTGAFGTLTLERQRSGNKWIEKSRSAR